MVLKLVFCLLFLHRAVVVDEDEGALIVRVDIALGALVAGTEIALEAIRFIALRTLWVCLVRKDRDLAASSSKLLPVGPWVRSGPDLRFVEAHPLSYCHGLFVRWGDTRTQLPRREL